MTAENKRLADEREHLDETYLKMAQLWADSRSYGTRLKVGAFIVKNRQIVSDGYNGMPSRFPHEEMEYYEDLGFGEVIKTNPLVLHAESNAILKCAANAGVGTEGATLYSTVSPCVPCALQIIQARIARVVYRYIYRDEEGLKVLHRAGIELTHRPISDGALNAIFHR